METMTDECVVAWSAMRIRDDVLLRRVVDWANMLERRLAELDPLYRAYPFGRQQSNG